MLETASVTCTFFFVRFLAETALKRKPQIRAIFSLPLVTLNAGERRWRKVAQNENSTVINSRMKNGSFGAAFHPVTCLQLYVQQCKKGQVSLGLGPGALRTIRKGHRYYTRMQNVFCCSLTSGPSTVTLLSYLNSHAQFLVSESLISTFCIFSIA